MKTVSIDGISTDVVWNSGNKEMSLASQKVFRNSITKKKQELFQEMQWQLTAINRGTSEYRSRTESSQDSVTLKMRSDNMCLDCLDTIN